MGIDVGFVGKGLMTQCGGILPNVSLPAAKNFDLAQIPKLKASVLFLKCCGVGTNSLIIPRDIEGY
jgi:hypothetical protein